MRLASLLPECNLFLPDNILLLPDPLIILININQNLILIILPLTLKFNQQHNNYRQTQTSQKSSSLLKHYITKHTQTYNHSISYQHSYMMCFHGFTAKIELSVFSYIVLLSGVDPVTCHKHYNDPGYHY